jgi:hypothetical protein
MNNSSPAVNSTTEIYINPMLTRPKITLEFPLGWNPDHYPRSLSTPSPAPMVDDGNIIFKRIATIHSDLNNNLIHILRFVEAKNGARGFDALTYCSIENKIELLRKALNVLAQTIEHQQMFSGLLDKFREAAIQFQQIIQIHYLNPSETDRRFNHFAQGLENVLNNFNGKLESCLDGFQRFAHTRWAEKERMRLSFAKLNETIAKRNEGLKAGK